MFSFLGKPKTNAGPEFSDIPVIIAAQIRAGKSPSETSLYLQNMSLDQERADFFVQEHYPKILRQFYHEKCSWKDVIFAVLFGLAVSLSVALFWGFLAAWMGDRLGFWAAFIGILCGFSVSWVSDGKKGFALQSVALICAAIGIFVGKYYIFYHYWGVVVSQDYGEVALLKMVPPVSIEAFRQFVVFFNDDMSRNLFTIFFDTFWLLLGLISAWKIPEGSNVPESSFQYLNDSLIRQQSPQEAVSAKKWILSFLSVCIIFVFVILLSLSNVRPSKDFLDQYDRREIEFVVNVSMRDKPDFQEHFTILKQETLEEIISEFEKFLQAHKDPSELEDEFFRLQDDFYKHISLMAASVYPEEFFKNPSQFPKVISSFYQFYRLHFQVALYYNFLVVNFERAPEVEPNEQVRKDLDKIKSLINQAQNEGN